MNQYGSDKGITNSKIRIRSQSYMWTKSPNAC